ncbi:hypothetical protein B0H15DRAFT_260004 [Mycena belliarum]|uniref:RING-type domain-containing protein n=1 Tax=Mycena belliarum TaxID=1033014 RepID=A0AAD6UA77_9AGAR|nr:hypothetical protein B0H15DRAFT_260004 [Mycena belliae]
MSSIPPVSAFDIKYCSLCDAYFYSEEMLKAHIKSSSRHPKCAPCGKSFLNNNSLRNHYVLSTRHHFCRVCEKQFQTPGGLRIHLDVSHLDSDTEDEPSTQPYGWEDRLALEEEAALAGGEIPIPQDDLASTTSQIPPTRAPKHAMGVLRLTCPICLAARKRMCATRCGHLFCASCITHALQETKSCPACRQPALPTQLRSLDLHVYANSQ